MRRGLAVLAVLALPVLLPQCSLACGRPVWESRAPDGPEVLSACARPMLFAMPGGGGDNDGWIVLRDARGFITGAVDVGLIWSVPFRPEWEPGRVSLTLHAELPRPPQRAAPLAFLVDRWWRLRALLGVTPHDSDFR